MSESLLDRHELEFYKYNGADMKELLGHVKEKLNAVADVRGGLGNARCI